MRRRATCHLGRMLKSGLLWDSMHPRATTQVVRGLRPALSTEYLNQDGGSNESEHRIGAKPK